MEFKAKTFWEMEKESISYARKNENLWVHQAVLAAVITALEKNELKLDHAFKAQDANDPKGHVAQKNQLLDQFFHNTYRLGRKLAFYAKDAGDKVLMNDVTISESTFQKISEKEALIKCNRIIQRGYEYLDKTAGYKITTEELKALTENLSLLEKMQPTIGIITNERKSARRSIKN